MLFSCVHLAHPILSADYTDKADKGERINLSALIRVICGEMPWSVVRLRLRCAGKSPIQSSGTRPTQTTKRPMGDTGKITVLAAKVDKSDRWLREVDLRSWKKLCESI